MAQNSKKSRIWVLSFLNGVFMLCFAFYWLSLPDTFGDETFLIKWSSLIKKSLFGFDAKPDPKEVLFVDISENKTTVDVLNGASPYHREVITDREQLAEFFNLINRYRSEVRFVLCDVLFEDATKQDAPLGKEFNQLGNKLLVISHLDEEGNCIRPIFRVPYAIATYPAIDGRFLKFPLLYQDSLKTVPLKMYERLHNIELKKKGFFYRFNGRLSLPSPIVDFKVRQVDFNRAENPFATYPMGLILDVLHNDSITAENKGLFFEALFKNKIILIGDLKNDMHLTPTDTMPGLLIIYNAYLTLVAKQNLVPVGWICFMLAAFTFLSHRIFADVKIEKPRWLLGMFQSKFGKVILNSLDELGLLIIITLLSYFLFNIHINILILLIYLKFIDFLWNRAGLRKTKSAAIEKAVPS